MKPETRRACEIAMAERLPPYAEYEAMFIAGMMEAARLCRERADELAKDLSARGLSRAIATLECAELIKSSVKGE